MLTHSENQTQKLYAVCRVAAGKGLSAGMTLAEARMVLPDLQVEAATPDMDAVKREELARWLVRYTPLTACDASDTDSILLDVTGCTHLFGGEAATLADIQRRLEAVGITPQLALAENRAAAWALSHYRPGSISISAAESKQLLTPLPVSALRLDKATEVKLVRLGLKTVGSLLALPRPTLAQRFRGQPKKQMAALLERLDQILGRSDEPFSPLVPVPSWSVRQAFSEPAMHLPMIETTVQNLLGQLLEMLARAELGIRRLGLYGFRVDGGVQQIVIGTNRPSRDSKHLLRLLLEKLDQLEAEFGFDLLQLSAEEIESLPPVQCGDIRAQQHQSASELLDRLAVRLGPAAIRRLQHRPSHMPERAQTFVPAHAKSLEWDSVPADQSPRPLRLLTRPELIDVLAEVPEGAPRRFRWRRMEHRVVKADGPERIAPEWWMDEGGKTRDYYRVEAEGGTRFWLFRSGLYPIPGVQRTNREDSSSSPTWYVHGFFA